MLFPAGATRRMSAEAAEGQIYDAVIVGGGISGAIIACELSRANKRVLILEAGLGGDRTLSGYEDYLSTFYSAASKDNQTPYPDILNVPMPRGTPRKLTPHETDASAGYLVQKNSGQNGSIATDTTYTRVLGGTTMHWEAKILRMLPDDFEMADRFGEAQNWPLKYAELKPYYEMAEREIGVSGDVSDQVYLDMATGRYRDLSDGGYVFPMQAIPLSYLDQMVAKGIQGFNVDLDGHSYDVKVRSFPQGRNGIPNPQYDGGNGYVPVGAVSTNQVEIGGRCQGNNNCVPICPVQAKYNANKTLAKALQTGRVDLLTQTVASRIHIDPSGRVSHIDYVTYRNPNSLEGVSRGKARGQIYVLSANAIENPRLMLASGLPSSSGLVGKNLMDHAYLLNWALMPMDCGTMRGTNCTGGITALRNGSFRRSQAAFSVDIHNDGWGWATGSPYRDLHEMVDQQEMVGLNLRQNLVKRITRQLLLAFMIEVLPSQSNCVTVNPNYRDQLGNMRPVISYAIPGYTMRGVAYARQFAQAIFRRLGAQDHTKYKPDDFAYLEFENQGYVIRGGNHLAGTHVMGTARTNSVVDSDQCSWDYKNLYLVGGGSMPTIGTANVTNTIAALCFKSARDMIKRL